MELQIWQNDWGLPSIDVDCLVVLNYNADYTLNSSQCSEALAYASLVKEKLVPAAQHLWWIDAKNYAEFSRPYYFRAIPFPFRFYYPSQFEATAKDLVNATYPGDLEDTTIETAVYKSAEECLNHLSCRLGEKDYFFGSVPSYLDAVVFAHLAPLLKAPFPSSALQGYLKSCPNLTKFVSRILNRFFQKDSQEYEEKKKKESASTSTTSDKDSFPNQRRHVILSVIAALFGMGFYAFANGMVQFGSSQNDDEYDEELEEEIEEELE
ncbi:metaxin-1-like isoform X2 [Artemia franciscana]|uniref:Metaxin-1 n=1 Tax=Artemia franciscana TaxID=6661 RepID=A0AA88HLX2_ARTSF|nr:hypothetical protein QYM36_013647 [Artemia franciscana]